LAHCGEGPQTPVLGLYLKEATPTPYTREEEEQEREWEGEQASEKLKQGPPSLWVACLAHHVTAVCSVSEYCIHSSPHACSLITTYPQSFPSRLLYFLFILCITKILSLRI
jgi:hypothetical protein